jgi:phosphoribosylformylglycinamidine synthase
MMSEIEILTKKGFKNSRGEHVLSDISGIGVRNVIKVEYSPLYIIDGDIDSAETERIASELLSDKVTETYIVRPRLKTDSRQYSGFISDSNEETDPSFSVIVVWYKRGVTDTVSESVVKAIKDLGIAKEVKVKTGHKYYLYGEILQSTLNNIATKLLANTLIQEYKIR